MFEIIKLLLDVFSNIFDPQQITNLRKEQKLKELGIELFLLYIRLNELLVNGQFIVEELRRYAYRTEPYTTGSGYWLRSAIKAQYRYIENVLERLKNFGFQLQILDTEAYYKLDILLKSKKASVQTLINMLASNILPIPNYDDLVSVIPSDPPNTWISSQGYEPEKSLDPIRDIINRKLHESSLSLTQDWDNDTYERLRSYLSSGEPEERLKEIRNTLEKLHEALIKNFNIQDILVAVGDKRFQESDIRNNM